MSDNDITLYRVTGDKYGHTSVIRIAAPNHISGGTFNGDRSGILIHGANADELRAIARAIEEAADEVSDA